MDRIGPAMDRILNDSSDYLQDQFSWQRGIKKELQRLRENKIKVMVSASIQDQNPALVRWISQLRDAIDEANNLLDYLEYMKHKEQLTRRNMGKIKKFISATGILFERALRIDPNFKRLEKVVQKLDKISTEVDTFFHLVQKTNQKQQKQKLQGTGPTPKGILIGRVEDLEFVMQWLRKPSIEDPPMHITHSTWYKNISLLSIVGHGGIGKTALLQHVFEDLKDEFELKMWVWVSSDFDQKRVMASMLNIFKDESESLSLAILERDLKSMVLSKKFLLVLDDIWEDEEGWDYYKWENMFSLLAYGSMGSKILITTRMDSVASMMAEVIGNDKITMLRLEGLEEDECLELLCEYAFVEVDNLNDHKIKKLRCIGKEIVKKLSGSPMAAKDTGRVLRSNLNESHWMSILNHGIESVKLF